MSDETSPAGRWLQPVPALRRGGLPARLRERAGLVKFEQPVSRLMDAERDRLFLWAPVAFGVGIAVYFSLPREPSLAAVLLLCAVTGLAVRHTGFARPSGAAMLALFLACLGLLDGTLRSRMVAAPVISERIGPVEMSGRIESVEHRENGAARLRVAPDWIADSDALPRRLSLWSRGSWPVPAPGDDVRLRAVVMPPPDAAVPGGFDYARQAWFDGIGGVGFIVAAPAVDNPPIETTANRGILANASEEIERFRLGVAGRITDALSGPAGAVAAALITGQRGAIPEDDQEALRASGLAHILAISGLHMMLVVGTLFWVARALLALSPALALSRPIKKWAALLALAGGAGYLLLSGGSIATQRAFIMAAIMLVAILFDRPAITLRNVAIAALVVLALTPEALVTASFQMSFAATIALVAAYEGLRTVGRAAPDRPGPPALRFVTRAVIGLILTALIAGLATGPFAAFHFNRIAVYGLAGNVAAMPLVSILVMPAGLVSVVLMPFGLEAPALAVMGLGIDGVLAVAQRVASWDGAVHMVPQMPVVAFVAIVSGGLWLALWRTRWRLAGLPAIAAGIALSAAAPLPDVLISRNAGMAALRTENGDLVFLPRATSDYEAETWLRTIGLPIDGTSARSTCDRSACVAASGGIFVAYVTDPQAFREDCGFADVIVTSLSPPDWCRDGALVVGPQDARQTGAVTVRRSDRRLVVSTAAERTGRRPWAQRTTHPGAVYPGPANRPGQ